MRRSRLIAAAAASALAAAALTNACAPPASADTVTASQAWRVVQQYQGVWTAPPSHFGTGDTPDGPLLGNGDIGVTAGGPITNQTFYLGKNDFFSLGSHAIKPLGRIVLAVPGLSGASYRMVQDIARGQAQGTYTLGGTTLTATSWVSATSGVFVTSLSVTGSSQAATFTVQNGSGGTPTVSTSGSVLNADVSADGSGPQARVASRVIGGSQSVSGNRISVTLNPGTTYTFVAGIVSSIDNSGYQGAATGLVSALTQAGADDLAAAHRSWWQGFWQQSYVEIPDKAVEKQWYGSLYILGSTSRAGKYAPGLWGSWITGSMNWNGDYHTNYNYQAPFYAALSSNHIPLLEPYDQPVLDWQTPGQALAAQQGFTGVLYPVGLSPKGTSADMNLHNQKSNAANLASVMIMRWLYTRDTAYAQRVYPWLKQVALFWQNYLTVDGSGTYHVTNDAPQEDNPYPQTDSSLTLGLLHLLMGGLADMSAALGQDSGTRATWTNIDAHLAPFATTTVNGQTVFRETSTGAGFVNDGNDIVIQHVYPGLQVGLNSSATLQQTARNTIGQLSNAWHGGNAPPTFYAAAAAVGYDPGTILAGLRAEATQYAYPNMAIHHSGGGIEGVNVVAGGLGEMLLQSFQGDIKVFPAWPSGTSAKFGDLLARGGFLVSASRAGGTVQYIRIVSQKGGTATVTNPWGGSVQVYRNGASAGTVSGARLTLATSAGETIALAPAGTALATINAQLAQPMQTGGGSTSSSFASGFEASGPALSWSDTVDSSGGGLAGVGGLCCGLSGPEAGARTGETFHAGTGSLMYSGAAQGGSAVHAYLKVYDLGGAPLAIGSGKTLSYWIYPQSSATTPYVPAGATTSTCVAIDLIFTDGTALRDSGSTDQTGDGAHPSAQCGHLTLDAWNQVTVNLGTRNANKQINRILVGFDAPNATGGYRGYVDDLNIS
ncbi:glycosyl hydrolase family 95 catalytic domain-containing protein [Dactylosporangium darangshiense]|uniref:Glycosyl hydrolase family 95 catalytic domain-containing protein n=1 Tax=Dactylosporangium darangshiense TaxID=579108 RepID=A0ABP8D7A6_9ACTN